uniref:OTU domain-containing protein n=1 Tax=Anopheles dirus TaxID=7168 RepID=A0A182NV39_9DIPT
MDSDEQDPSGYRLSGSGSHDVNDKFLEQIGLYRKHTAPDASCLFRAVAEQRYDVQLHHDRVRRECVAYMRANRTRFEQDIDRDFELYMESMLQPESHGTLLELKALALCHGANVLLYKPNTDGHWVVNDPSHDRMWRMFVDRNLHFDTIYTMEYMRTAALCQAIVYEVLYKSVLRLPDVDFAVEVMLRGVCGTAEVQDHGETVARAIDGRRLPLCRNVANTSCALSIPQLCHFHNPDGFELVQQYFNVHGTVEGCRKYIGEHFPSRADMQSPLLPVANVSCVQQLLSMGIAPISYTAAKALDPHMYRNTELDSWLATHVEPPFQGRKASPVDNTPEPQQPVIVDETVCLDPPQRQEQQLTTPDMFKPPLGLYDRTGRMYQAVYVDPAGNFLPILTPMPIPLEGIASEMKEPRQEVIVDETLVGTDYPAYLKALKSSKTPGTMVDLKALSALYR